MPQLLALFTGDSKRKRSDPFAPGPGETATPVGSLKIEGRAKRMKAKEEREKIARMKGRPRQIIE